MYKTYSTPTKTFSSQDNNLSAWLSADPVSDQQLGLHTCMRLVSCTDFSPRGRLDSGKKKLYTEPASYMCTCEILQNSIRNKASDFAVQWSCTLYCAARGFVTIFQLKKCCNIIVVDMAAARCSSDVLQMFYGSITEEENTNLPQPSPPDVVGVWKMYVPENTIKIFKSYWL